MTTVTHEPETCELCKRYLGTLVKPNPAGHFCVPNSDGELDADVIPVGTNAKMGA